MGLGVPHLAGCGTLPGLRLNGVPLCPEMGHPLPPSGRMEVLPFHSIRKDGGYPPCGQTHRHVLKHYLPHPLDASRKKWSPVWLRKVSFEREWSLRKEYTGNSFKHLIDSMPNIVCFIFIATRSRKWNTSDQMLLEWYQTSRSSQSENTSRKSRRCCSVSSWRPCLWQGMCANIYEI